MTAPRDLRAAIAEAGFTPGRRDVAPLVALLAGDEAVAPAVRRALARADADAVARAIAEALPGLGEGEAARVVTALGDAATRSAAARAGVLAAVDDARPRARRAAVTALGKLGGDDARAAVCAYWDRTDLAAADRRAAAAALGKLGGDDATRRLAAATATATAGADVALARIGGRALLVAERDADDAPSEVVLDVAPPAPVPVVATCRPGLETLLAGELHDAGLVVERLGPGRVRVQLAGPLGPLLAARTLLAAGVLVELPAATGAPRPAPFDTPSLRSGGSGRAGAHPPDLHARIIRESEAVAESEDVDVDVDVDVAESGSAPGSAPAGDDPLVERIARALARPDVLALLAAWTRGPIRWRLDVEGGGHRRGLVWATAARVRALAPALRNQPRATTWDVVVTADQRHLELRPRRYRDDRFGWRVADVPAASHPTVAAALALVAGVGPPAADGGPEHVWDPFTGSGGELCERGRLGPARLHGSDLDERALGAARQNLAAAGLAARLVRADALTHTLPPLGLVITNPPLGRRLRGDAGLLLERFAARVPRLLAPGGRLVWITPAAARTAAVLRRGGLDLAFARDVDLGGYEVRLERWERRDRRR